LVGINSLLRSTFKRFSPIEVMKLAKEGERLNRVLPMLYPFDGSISDNPRPRTNPARHSEVFSLCNALS
jgi:hypothetical protein